MINISLNATTELPEPTTELPETTTEDPLSYIYAAAGQFAAWAYLITAVFVFVGNGALLYPLIYHKALRTKKEFVFIAGLAFADMMNGLAFLLAGVWRAWRISYGSSNNSLEFTGLHCSLMPFNLIWNIFYPTAGVMLCAMTLDRLFLTVATMWYISQGPLIAQVIIGVVLAHGFGFGLIVLIYGLLYLDADLVGTDLCYQSAVMSPLLYQYNLNCFNYGHVGSIAIFLVALLFYARHNKRMAAVGDSGQVSAASKAAAKQQRDMTIKVAWSAAATLLLVIIPVQVASATISFMDVNLNSLFYTPNNLNPLFNVYLFLWKSPLIKKGLVKALKGKTMPINLKDW